MYKRLDKEEKERGEGRGREERERRGGEGEERDFNRDELDPNWRTKGRREDH